MLCIAHLATLAFVAEAQVVCKEQTENNCQSKSNKCRPHIVQNIRTIAHLVISAPGLDFIGLYCSAAGILSSANVVSFAIFYGIPLDLTLSISFQNIFIF